MSSFQERTTKTPYAHQRNARQQNTSALLFDLWHNAPQSRAALAQRNGLTKATVSAICDELTALNLIQEMGQDRSSIGRPGNLLALNPQARGAIGLEISTNYVAVLLTDMCGDTIWRDTVSTALGCPQEEVLRQAEALLAAAIEQAQSRGLPLLGLGVAVPGIVDSEGGQIISAPALGWRNTSLRQWETRFGLPVIVENKARSGAMAEALRGAARGIRTFVYISIGTDVGSSVDAAVVIDGALYRGAHGLAVDAGHMTLDPNGELCSCGQRGCWQAQADVAREAVLVSARLAGGEASALSNLPKQDLENHRTIHQAALEGDPLAMEVFRSVITLGHAPGIVNLIYLFDPELVLIGFANVGLPSAFRERMEALMHVAGLGVAEEVRKRITVRGLTPPAIERASQEPNTVMLGAAMLLVDDFLRKPPVAGG